MASHGHLKKKKKNYSWNIFHSMSHAWLQRINFLAHCSRTSGNINQCWEYDGGVMEIINSSQSQAACTKTLHEWHWIISQHPHLALCKQCAYLPFITNVAQTGQVDRKVIPLNKFSQPNQKFAIKCVICFCKLQPGPPTWPILRLWLWWLACLPGEKPTCPRSWPATSTG